MDVLSYQLDNAEQFWEGEYLIEKKGNNMNKPVLIACK